MDDLDALMLDAFRRGMIMVYSGAPSQSPDISRESLSLDQLRSQICNSTLRLSPANKMKVVRTVAAIVGIDAISSYNKGCLVDITHWTRDQLNRLNEVITFISK